MDQPNHSTTDIEIAYEPDYEIDDEVFFEPFVVLKPMNYGRPNWWKNRKKVEKLIAAFKLDLDNHEACVQAGISIDQYKNFCSVHEKFYAVKVRCKTFTPILAKQGLVKDIQDPKGMQQRRWYLERRQPHIYGRDISAYTPVPPEASQRITAEAFLDEKGDMIISKEVHEILRKEYGDDDSGTPSPRPEDSKGN